MALSAVSIATLIRVAAQMVDADTLMGNLEGEPGFPSKEEFAGMSAADYVATREEIERDLDSLAAIYAADGFMTALPIPQQLNGYPVIKAQVHKTCVTVMLDRGWMHQPFVVATWDPFVKEGWLWGHYSAERMQADADFEEAVQRNARRP